MKFELKPYHRSVSDEELLADLRKVAESNGGLITQRIYDANGQFVFGTFVKRFGSWNGAIRAAGLGTTREVNISDDALFENIEELWLKLGRQPKYGEFKAPLSKFSAKPYETRFGSWYKALEKFVEVANSDIALPVTEIDTIDNIEPQSFQFHHKTKRDINLRMRWLVQKRDNFKCVACGRSPAKDANVELHVDHIKPWSKGGETVLDNLQTLCATCNLGKGNVE